MALKYCVWSGRNLPAFWLLMQQCFKRTCSTRELLSFCCETLHGDEIQKWLHTFDLLCIHTLPLASRQSSHIAHRVIIHTFV